MTSPEQLRAQVERLGADLRRHALRTHLRYGLGALLLLTGVLALTDGQAPLAHSVRLLLWFGLLTLALAAAFRVIRIGRRAVTAQGIAARIEAAFPQLDNRLINRLQFAQDTTANPFKQAYLEADFPEWPQLDFRALRHDRRRRQANRVLIAGLLVLVLPGLLSGSAGAVALRRIVFPFDRTAPANAPRILAVMPGDVAILPGADLELSCRVHGRRGLRVLLETDVGDTKIVSRTLGILDGAETETHSVAMTSVTTAFRYRFRVGDGVPSTWHAVTLRAPLSLSSVAIRAHPPAYTGLPSQWVNALDDPLKIREGSRLEIQIEANQRIESATLLSPAAATFEPMDSTGRRYQGSVVIEASGPLELRIVGAEGETQTPSFAYAWIPDQPPRIRILAPRGPTLLAPGAVPVIDFEVEDDYGLSSVVLRQEVSSEPADPSDVPAGEIVAQWSPDASHPPRMVGQWRGTETSTDLPVITFRVQAADNRDEIPAVTFSEPIRFTRTTAANQADDDAPPSRVAVATATRLVEQQREALNMTRDALDAVPSAETTPWDVIRQTQADVRRLARTLLDLPGNPLGNLATRVRQLYIHEMAEAVTLLDRVAALSGADDRRTPAERARVLQERILRALETADAAVSRREREQRELDLHGLLRTLIRGQTDIVEHIGAALEQERPVPAALAERQDNLSAELQAFERICRREADHHTGGDPDFSDRLRRMADQSEQRQIRETMLLTADRLEQDRIADARPLAKQAAAELDALAQWLTAVHQSALEDRQAEMRETILDVRNRLERIQSVHAQAINTMDAVQTQGDASGADLAMMAEEYDTLLRTTREALLEIPADLHIFPELNVAHEFIEDIITVFEEILQRPGSASLDAEDVEFQPYSKEDLQEMLAAMGQAGDVLDDLEMWMVDQPDNQQITFEAFDAEELPEGGVALNELADRLETLIGDLLEESDDLRQAAQDGATNLADDIPFGDAILEGETTSFSADGQIGNVRPDAVEQDGRSTIGREGMASGETAARAGTIEEGDLDIPIRRTQDPTQDGMIAAEGGSGAQATGGGKLGTGGADELGMAGGVRRMDAMTGGSEAGMEALLAERAQTLYQQASLHNIRSHDLQMAAHHLRQAADAAARGRPIAEIAERRRQASVALRRATTDLNTGQLRALTEVLPAERLEGVVHGGSDEAPPEFRPLVAEYFKRLNEDL